MVLKKRQYYGFSGFHIPSIPRAPRSARGRGLHKRKDEDSQICAFELLASLAGKLLQESESSSASSNASLANIPSATGNNVIKQGQDEDKPLKTELLDQGSCEESTFVRHFATLYGDRKSIHAESDGILEQSSIITNSDSSEKVSSDMNVICKTNNACEKFPCKVGGIHDPGESCHGYIGKEFSRQQRADGLETAGLTVDNACSSKDPMNLRMKFPATNNLDNNVKLPSHRDPVPNASILRHRYNVKLGIRDDDEIFSRFNKTTTKPKVFRPSPGIGDRRIRKLLTSKYWKVAPKLKDFEHSKLDGRMKPFYRKRKICYNRGRYHHDTFYKRRKLYDHSLVVNSDGGFSSESVCNSPQKGMNGDKTGSAAMFLGDTGVTSSAIGQQSSFHSKDSHVKFGIKSFKIPELFIEVSETATVGSLKRTVMEAVTAILGRGLCVGVLLQGKKVRDDNRTLSQTGITSKGNLDTLGFTLEPNPPQAPPVCTEVSPLQLKCENSQQVPRSPASPVLDTKISDALPDPPPLTNSANNVDSNHEIVSSQTDILTDNSLPHSRAPVAVPQSSADALALVPVNQKPRRTELVQRRTRRPFSVSEVEALVEAVEELGTGRWRDVKLRSFENADHRTYVDLKDKWKTLVHTAKIAPQQRRGEPVPQELLDRVLAAHACWSQHQARQLSKNQAAILKITEGHAARN